ncbi:MAG: ribosome-associated translation inhibitor RaiA [Oscillospiraceae bacterium]|jgi:putative sigma-54 modulation protein|nr:ribosome-associated translation inhibitor RaiA [Oscillospiraceae bacterium]
MKVTYTARKVNLRDNFKERVEKKLLKFGKIFSEDAEASVNVTLQKNTQTVEITIRDNSNVYRAESSQTEMNDALDKVVDILSGQMRKHKTKLSRRLREGKLDEFVAEAPDVLVEEDAPFEIVRRKEVPLKPVSVDEAILQMNMVNHKFYMFKNAETEQVNVVYVRNDGAYGLLEPTFK